jgi:hypothetical protein
MNEGVLNWLDSLLQRVASAPPKQLDSQDVLDKIKFYQQKLSKLDPEGNFKNSKLAQAVKKKILSFIGIQEGWARVLYMANVPLALINIAGASLSGNTALAVSWGCLAVLYALLSEWKKQDEIQQVARRPNRRRKPKPKIKVKPKIRVKPISSKQDFDPKGRGKFQAYDG